MSKLIVTVGFPRSGKTTWAKLASFELRAPIVNPDSVRLAIHGQRYVAAAEPFVWAAAYAMVPALFLAGHTRVIVDATNTTRKRRDVWIDERWETFFHHVDTPVEVCRQRADAERDTKILPIIQRMHEQFQPLQDDEPRWDGVLA